MNWIREGRNRYVTSTYETKIKRITTDFAKNWKFITNRIRRSAPDELIQRSPRLLKSSSDSSRRHGTGARQSKEIRWQLDFRNMEWARDTKLGEEDRRNERPWLSEVKYVDSWHRGRSQISSKKSWSKKWKKISFSKFIDRAYQSEVNEILYWDEFVKRWLYVLYGVCWKR